MVSLISKAIDPRLKKSVAIPIPDSHSSDLLQVKSIYPVGGSVNDCVRDIESLEVQDCH